MYDFGSKQGMLAYTSITTRLSSAEGNGLGELRGSSAATAVIGGVAALVRARYPALTNAQVMDRLISTADNVCQDGPKNLWRNRFVNALAAVGGPCAGPLYGPGNITIVATPNSAQTYQLSTDATSLGPNGTYVVTWLDGTTGLSTNYTFYAQPYYSTVDWPIYFDVTDPATGVTVRRSRNVRLTTQSPTATCGGRVAC
jgi:subtilisin family serine protease